MGRCRGPEQLTGDFSCVCITSAACRSSLGSNNNKPPLFTILSAWYPLYPLYPPVSPCIPSIPLYPPVSPVSPVCGMLALFCHVLYRQLPLIPTIYADKVSESTPLPSPPPSFKLCEGNGRACYNSSLNINFKNISCNILPESDRAQTLLE